MMCSSTRLTLLALLLVASAAAAGAGQSLSGVRSLRPGQRAISREAQPRTGQARRPLASRHATVMQGTGLPGTDNATVLIRDGRTAATGPAADGQVLGGERLADGARNCVIPVVIEEHAPVSKTGASAVALFVASGLPTVRA